MKELSKNKNGGIISGVCQGLSDFTGINPWIFRGVLMVPFVFGFFPGIISIAAYVGLNKWMKSEKTLDENEVIEIEYEIVDDDKESDKEK